MKKNLGKERLEDSQQELALTQKHFLITNYEVRSSWSDHLERKGENVSVSILS